VHPIGFVSINRSYNKSKQCQYPCNSNISYWEIFYNIFGNSKCQIIGVLFTSFDDLKSFSNKKRTNFGLYLPKNIQKFKELFKITGPSSRTILTHNNKIKYSKIGKYSSENFATEAEKLNKIIERSIK
jgi:hypothetical protein